MTFSHYEHSQSHSSTSTLDLAELLGMLSFALDLTEGQPQGHALRSAWIGAHLGQLLGISGQEQSDLLYTLLLKDVGCSSNASRISQMFLTDDLAFKREYKTTGCSLPNSLGFVLRATGPEAPWRDRMRAIFKIITKTDAVRESLIATRCERGADIAAQLRFSTTVQDGIRNLDEHWDGSGAPLQLTGNAIPRVANITLLAQVADVFHTMNGTQAAIAAVTQRSGSWFDPELVTAFKTLAEDPAIWAALCDPAISDRVMELPGARRCNVVDAAYLDDIAKAFAQIVDAKSPYTADHSERVTVYADMIAQEMGLDQGHRRWLRRAALLHDLGKLAVSNQILDKPGKLDAHEWDVIRSHPYQSERLLSQIKAFRDIAAIAGGHHERLDGGGYPNGIGGSELPIETRILTAADVFDALSARRPYREAMPIETCLNIMDQDAGKAFDPEILRALQSALKRIRHRAA